MSTDSPCTVSISVVSHRQADLIRALLDSLRQHCATPVELLITSNLPEDLALPEQARFPVRRWVNDAPQGFGANHNAAFRQARGDYFCVLNPDIRLTADPLPGLLSRLRDHPEAGVIAPRVVAPDGRVEDSARSFPSPWSIARKLAGRNRDRQSLHDRLDCDTLAMDWVAGMFMLFPRRVFEDLGGFDERYFLYYEDVDLCSRLHAAGRAVLYSPPVSVIHDARRESHRNLRYLRWHLASMLRFFVSHFLRQLRPLP